MTKIKMDYVNEYTDRHGRPRRYFRKDGKNVGPLPLGSPLAPEFTAAYQAYLAHQPVAIVRQQADGSFAKLITAFKASPLFLNLKPSSRKAYCAALDPLAREHGHRAAALLTPDAVDRIIARIGRDKPAMANLTKKALHRALKFAVKAKLISANPVTDIEPFKIGEHHSWTEAELRQYEHKWRLGTRERLAYALLLYTAQRVGDCARMHRSDVSGDMIHVIQEKTGAELWIPIHPELDKAMRAYPAKGLTLIGDAAGRPIQGRSLGKLMARAIDEAGLPPRCVAHGLRKAALRRLAEADATAKQIAAISGHEGLSEVQRYTKAADQKKLARAAMDKLRGEK
jgi:integrase